MVLFYSFERFVHRWLSEFVKNQQFWFFFSGVETFYFRSIKNIRFRWNFKASMFENSSFIIIICFNSIRVLVKECSYRWESFFSLEWLPLSKRDMRIVGWEYILDEDDISISWRLTLRMILLKIIQHYLLQEKYYYFS
jgi:hypothetical protein